MPDFHRLNKSKTVEINTVAFDELGMEALHPHYSQVITPGGFCRKAHEAGIAVHTWTVNTSDEIVRVLTEGADIVITNYPDMAVKLLEETVSRPVPEI